MTSFFVVELDQPDRVSGGTGAQGSITLTPVVTLHPPGPAKAGDTPDGPLHVHVEQTTRQFYNAHKDKVRTLILMSK